MLLVTPSHHHFDTTVLCAATLARVRPPVGPLPSPSWRGWFPVGDEFTSGKVDQKEGAATSTLIKHFLPVLAHFSGQRQLTRAVTCALLGARRADRVLIEC